MKPLKQQGFVLLQVMLVFSILVVVAASMQYSQRIHIERTQQMLFSSQAQAYAESAEDIARVGLMLDWQSTSNDHLYELWNTSEGFFPLDEGGLIQLEINDLQGRFNLNWLSQSNDQRDSAIKAFERLLTLLGIDTSISSELALWFDENGGNDFFYSDEIPAYAPSFTEMGDVSELLLLKSVDRAVFEELFPYVSALPNDSELNINTAPLEILQSVASFVDEGSANQAITDRGEAGFDSVEEFLNMEVIRENEEAGIWLSNLTVQSNWFEIYTSVTLSSQVSTQRSIAYRDDEGVIITARDQSATASNPMPDDPVKSVSEDEFL